MFVKILGSAAGGGFPQWNCFCANCTGVRANTIRAKSRTQSSIAISADGARWILVNASPDIRFQINDFAWTTPRSGSRDSPFAGVILTDAQIDHSSGLLFLREGSTLDLYCTDVVKDELRVSLPILNVLDRFCGVRTHSIATDGTSFNVPDIPSVEFQAIPLQGKAPRFSSMPGTEKQTSHVIGLKVLDRHSGRTLLYAPGIAQLDGQIQNHMAEADCLLLDGTFWRDDEMEITGCGSKRARDMGHVALSGEGGLLKHLETIRGSRKILVHINNTNPILNESSPEHLAVRAAGVEVAFDGMTVEI